MSPEEIAGRYILIRELGSGGMAAVHLARDRVLERDIAIKVLRPDLAKDEQFVARFRREARAAGRLKHPGIVQVHDCGQDGRWQYITMELVDGESGADLLRRTKALEPETAAGIARQVCTALEYAHSHGVIHRDVKPGNLMIVGNPAGGEELAVKLTDFGIARVLEEVPITRTDVVLGTAAYLSPEQLRGEEATPRSDVYALGVVLYQLLTGCLPYEGSSAVEIAMRQQQGNPRSPRDHRRSIPPTLSDAVMRAMDEDERRRFESAGALSIALGEAMGIEEEVGEPETPTVALPRPPADEPATVKLPAEPVYVRSGIGGRLLRFGMLVSALAIVVLLALVVADRGDDPMPSAPPGAEEGGGGKGAEGAEGESSGGKGGGGESAGQSGDPIERPPQTSEAERHDASLGGQAEGGGETTPPSRSSAGRPVHAVSRYGGGGYRAEIDSVEQLPNGFALRFSARGSTDLRRPETSCVEAAGALIQPRKVHLSTERPGLYVGTYTFPYGGAGRYLFRYSCQRDYSAAPLFVRRQPLRQVGAIPGLIGVSRYDANYSARIGPLSFLSSGWFTVGFDASGFSDLREPQTSCVKVGADVIRPAAVSLSVDRPDRYVGVMRFQEKGAGSYRFVYSCESDYSPVPLFRR